MPVRGGEQCSIGFQPVPRDHCAWPVKSTTPWEWLKAGGSIGAGHRLEAYATLLLRLAEEFCKVVLGYSEMEGSVESCRIT